MCLFIACSKTVILVSKNGFLLTLYLSLNLSGLYLMNMYLPLKSINRSSYLLFSSCLTYDLCCSSSTSIHNIVLLISFLKSILRLVAQHPPCKSTYNGLSFMKPSYFCDICDTTFISFDFRRILIVLGSSGNIFAKQWVQNPSYLRFPIVWHPVSYCGFLLLHRLLPLHLTQVLLSLPCSHI